MGVCIGFAYEGYGLGFEFGAQAQAYAEDGAFVLSPFSIITIIIIIIIANYYYH